MGLGREMVARGEDGSGTESGVGIEVGVRGAVRVGSS